MAQDFPVRATHRCSLVSGMIVAALERRDGCAAPAPRVLWTVMVDAERRLQHTRRGSAAGFPRRRDQSARSSIRDRAPRLCLPAVIFSWYVPGFAP